MMNREFSDEGGDVWIRSSLKQLSEETESVCRLYGLWEKMYESVKRKVLFHVLRMYDVVGKLYNGVNIMCVNNLIFVIVKGG